MKVFYIGLLNDALELFYLSTVLISGVVCLKYCVLFHLRTGDFPSRMAILGVCLFSLLLSIVISLLGNCDGFLFLDSGFLHSLGLTTITLGPLALYADGSPGGSSGYDADSNRSTSIPIGEPGQEYKQFGKVVPGMAYTEVSIVRSRIYARVVNTINSQESGACTVSDVLSCHDSAHKVVKYAFSELGQKYDLTNVLATKTLDGKGVHFSPAALKIQQMR